MDSNEFRRAIGAAADEIIDYVDTSHNRPVRSTVRPGYLKELLPNHAPEDGERWEEIQKDIELKVMPGMNHWNSPKFMAWFPAPTSYPSMLGELYSSALNVSAFNWECAPAVTELEMVVMDWLAKALNLPACYLSSSDGGGIMQGTTSEAVIATMVAARERFLLRKTAHLEGAEKEEAIAQYRVKMVAIGSNAAHMCTRKGAMIIGVRYQSVPVSIEDDFSMTGPALEQTLWQCRQAGLEPFFLTATLGTTGTCAVDRFDEIAQVLQDEPEIWVHVDAAYAGSALVCEEYQHLTADFEAFDSFSMTMSKWLLTNLDACCLFIKNRNQLTGALSVDAPYLRNHKSLTNQITDYRHWQIPLSRRFRALKIWFVMRTYGLNGFKAYIRNHINCADLFSTLVASRPDLFNIITAPAFALTALQIVPSSSASASASASDNNNKSVARANACTKAVYEAVYEQGEIMVTSTVVEGLYIIRVVCANPKTEAKYMQLAFDILVNATEQLFGDEAADQASSQQVMAKL